MIRSCLATKNLAAASKWFHKIKGASKNPSIGMVTALMNVQLKAGEPLVAYKTIADGLDVFKKRSGSTRVQFSSEMAQILAEDLKGKHIDYLRDNLRLSFLPMRYRAELVGKIMTACLQPQFQEEPLPDLVISLYKEFQVEKGCVNDIAPSHIAHISAIEAFGIKGMVDSAEKIFKENIDTSFAREKDYYNALIKAYSRNGKRREASHLYADFKAHGLLPDVGTFEALLTEENDKSAIKHYLKNIMSGGIMAHPKLHPIVFRLCEENKVPLVPSLLNL
jgi:pentatricopeptide repeat protein